MTELLTQLALLLTALISFFSPAPMLGAVEVIKAAEPIKNDSQIETLRKIEFAGTELKTITGTGYLTEDNIIVRNNLRGNGYTDNEYRQIKEEIVSKSRTGTMNPDEELMMYIEFLNNVCAGKTLNGIPTQKEMNVFIENNECK